MTLTAITTRFHPTSSWRGAMMSAQVMWNDNLHRFELAYDHELSEEQNHVAAAEAMVEHMTERFRPNNEFWLDAVLTGPAQLPEGGEVFMIDPEKVRRTKNVEFLMSRDCFTIEDAINLFGTEGAMDVINAHIEDLDFGLEHKVTRIGFEGMQVDYCVEQDNDDIEYVDSLHEIATV